MHPLINTPSQDKLGVKLWEYERYAGSDWELPKLVGIECIECHVGRQAIDLRGLMVWATTLLSRVSKPQNHTLTAHYFAAWVMCLVPINAIYCESPMKHYERPKDKDPNSTFKPNVTWTPPPPTFLDLTPGSHALHIYTQQPHNVTSCPTSCLAQRCCKVR